MTPRLSLRIAPILLAAVGVACGDSSGTGAAAGSGTGASTSDDGGGGASDGGNATGANGGGGSTSDTMGGGGEGTGGTFTECPTAVTNVPEGACDLYLQNCPSADDTCEIGDSDPQNPEFQPITACVTRNGLKGIGEACNAPNDCNAHLTCVGNQCTPFCCPDDPNSCGGGECNITVTLLDDENMETMWNFRACSFSSTCTFFDPDSCEDGQNCYLGAQAGTAACYTPADGPGTELPDGSMCHYQNECLDSSVCIGPGDCVNGPDCDCRFLCEINSNDPEGFGGCPDNQLCDTNQFDFGFPDIGFCHP